MTPAQVAHIMALGKVARDAFDDYWHEDSKGFDSEAWAQAAQAVEAALRDAPQQAEVWVMVPKRPTQAMRDVMDSEGWAWEDLLAAAEAITEDEYAMLAARSSAPTAVEPVQNKSKKRKWRAGLGDILDATKHQAAAEPTAEQSTVVEPDERAEQTIPNGDWLRCKLMDWCKKRGVSPASFNDLFAIVGEARAERASKGTPT